MFKIFCLLLLLVASALADGGGPTYRELACRVVDEAGVPIRGVTVRLGGLERDAPDFKDDEDRVNREPGWKFTTDADGRFAARFGCFHLYERGGVSGFDGPCYGEFYFVVVKPGWAGGVSREILNLDDAVLASVKADADGEGNSSGENQEWSRGEFSPLLLRDAPSKSDTLVIVLKRGLDLHGRMLDTAGQPVRGQSVGVSLDLHYGSHTGMGGMIFWQGTTTDRAGRFHLRHVYPNVFTVQAADGSEGSPYWIKTRVSGRWVDKIEDEITPRTGGREDSAGYERSIDLRLLVSHRPLYRYFGQVTDPGGHPVAGIKVMVRNVRHEPVRGWGESHGGGQATRTDRAGNYSLRVGSRFVDGIWVYEDEYRGDVWADDNALFPPGRYDLTVQPKQASD